MPGYGNPMLGGRDRITQALMNIQNPPPGGASGLGGGLGGGMMQPAAPVGGMAGMPTPMPGSFGPPMGTPQGGMGGGMGMVPGMNLPGVDVNVTPPGMKQQASRGY